MARPKPNVFLEHIDKEDYDVIEICEGEGLFAVLYRGKSFNVRTRNLYLDGVMKYKKISFANIGHAFSLAKKLNSLFKTTDFKVRDMFSGEDINEKEYYGE